MSARNRLTPPVGTKNFIYHIVCGNVQCVCGVDFQPPHTCNLMPFLRRVNLVCCKYVVDNDSSCILCVDKAKTIEYNKQWIYDYDGYSVCSTCYTKCDFGVLCECCT